MNHQDFHLTVSFNKGVIVNRAKIGTVCFQQYKEHSISSIWLAFRDLKDVIVLTNYSLNSKLS